MTIRIIYAIAQILALAITIGYAMGTLCIDSSTRFIIAASLEQASCSEAKEDPWKFCARSGAVRFYCPTVCHTCRFGACKDSVVDFTIYEPSRVSSCLEARGDLLIMCKNKDVRKYCPRTCNACLDE